MKAFAVVVAGVLGFVVSLFTAGPAFFADGGFSERPPAALVSIVLFAAVGFAAGFVVPASFKAVAITLGLVAIPVPLLIGAPTFRDPRFAVLGIVFVLGDAAAGAFGSWSGARVRRQRARPG